MNKDQVLESYLNAKVSEKLIANLSRRFYNYFSRKKLTPENFKTHQSSFNASQSRVSTEIDETLSFYTALSRLTIEQSLLDDVQSNFKNHFPFETIDEEKDETYKWYYEQKDGQIFGPLKANEMDSRYQLGKFGKGTKLKTRQDDSYYPFINLIKRYCKILKSKKLNLDSFPKQLSNKIKKFKKGEVIKKKPFFGFKMVENEFQTRAKEGRTRTYAPRPNFTLNSLLKDEKKKLKNKKEEEEDLDTVPEGRGRAKTHV